MFDIFLSVFHFMIFMTEKNKAHLKKVYSYNSLGQLGTIFTFPTCVLEIICYLWRFKAGRAVFWNDGQVPALSKLSQRLLTDVDERSNHTQVTLSAKETTKRTITSTETDVVTQFNFYNHNKCTLQFVLHNIGCLRILKQFETVSCDTCGLTNIYQHVNKLLRSENSSKATQTLLLSLCSIATVSCDSTISPYVVVCLHGAQTPIVEH